MYANKFDNLNDMDKFLGNYNLPKVTQKEHKKFLYRNIFNYIFNFFKIEEDYLSDFFFFFHWHLCLQEIGLLPKLSNL